MRKASAIWLASSADVLVTHAAQLNPLHTELPAVKPAAWYARYVSQETSMCLVEDTRCDLFWTFARAAFYVVKNRKGRI